MIENFSTIKVNNPEQGLSTVHADRPTMGEGSTPSPQVCITEPSGDNTTSLMASNLRSSGVDVLSPRPSDHQPRVTSENLHSVGESGILRSIQAQLHSLQARENSVKVASSVRSFDQCLCS